jgi:hypothetical protein
LLAIPVVVFVVLREFRRLHSLTKEYELSKLQGSIADEIVRLSANNPRWIMLVTQTYSFISIVLLLSKFLL